MLMPGGVMGLRAPRDSYAMGERRFLLLPGGARPITGQWRGRLFMMRGEVVGLDISELKASDAIRLIRSHKQTLRSIAWFGAKQLVPTILKALGELPTPELTLSLSAAEGIRSKLCCLRILRAKVV